MTMKQKPGLIFSVLFSVLILISCGKSVEKRLIGTWKVADVQTQFNEDEVTPEMLRQVVEMQKQTYFRFLNDSTMVIISSNNTYEANWIIDSETNEITYFFKGMETQSNKLGRFDAGLITNETKTALGSMVITYEKSD